MRRWEAERLSMKRVLLSIWRVMPFWAQRMASFLIRPHFQVAAGALVFNDQGQLLLCRHSYRRLHPWGLPGGDLKYGEDPQAGVRRELWEETGLTAAETRLLLVESSQEIHQVSLTYLCDKIKGSFVPNDEVLEIRYFETRELPGLFDEQRLTIEKCLAILKTETR